MGVGHAALLQQGSAAKDDFYINAAEGPVEPQGKRFSYQNVKAKIFAKYVKRLDASDQHQEINSLKSEFFLIPWHGRFDHGYE